MNSEPYYVQIQNYILKQIREGELKPDDKIPSESQLSEMFGVSRITSSMAVNQLAQQGYVYRKRGKGTFVLGNRTQNHQGVSAATQMTYVFENSRQDVMESRHKTYDIRAVPASDEIAKHMEINPGEDVNQIVRIKYVADNPVCCEMIYIPCRLVGKMRADDLPDHVMIGEFLQSKGITVRRNKIYLESITAGIFEADRLNVDIGESLLLLEHMLLDDKHRPAAFSRLIVNNRNYKISLEFDTFTSLTVDSADK